MGASPRAPTPRTGQRALGWTIWALGVIGLAFLPDVGWSRTFWLTVAAILASLAAVLAGPRLISTRASSRLAAGAVGVGLAILGFKMFRAPELLRKAGSGSDAEALVHWVYVGALSLIGAAMAVAAIALAFGARANRDER